MRTARRIAALLAGSAVVFGSVAAPSIAHASTASSATSSTPGDSTAVTTDQVTAALNTASSASTAAESEGWSFRNTASDGGTTVYSTRAVYAVSQGRAQLTLKVGPSSQTDIAVQHKGDFASLGSGLFVLRPGIIKRALAVAGHPGATWVYTPDAGLDLTHGDGAVTTLAPHTDVDALLDPTLYTLRAGATETVNTDGTTVYDLPVRDVLLGAPAEVTVTLNAAGQMASVVEDFGHGSTETITASYGPQQITLPPAAQTVGWNVFARAVGKIAASDAHTIATKTAKRAVAAAHGHRVKIHTIRAKAAVLIKQHNHTWGDEVFTRRATTHGVRILATNPLTGQATGYTVAAHGKHARIRH